MTPAGRSGSLAASVLAALIAGLVAIPMLVEARRAASNEAAQRQRGGVEAEGDVYRIMRVAYPGVFVLMIAEQVVRARPIGTAGLVGVALFALAKALKWWAILTLGPSWTFRVIVVPDAPLVAAGPYRFLRHPNYVAVVLELVAAALMTGARITGPIGVVFFSLLMLKRIGVEERALGAPSPVPPSRG